MRSSGFGIVLAIMFLLFLMMGSVGRMAMVGGGFMMSQMLFPFLIIAIIALLVRPRSGWRERYRRAWEPPAPPPVTGTPEEVLRQRYARGELTRDQYQDAIMELLKSRYVTGELSLEEYEARVGTLLGDSRQRRLESGPKDYV